MDGGELGPLHGIPVAFKDLTSTAGIRTTMGSRLYENHVPDKDDPIVARVKKAGAIILGKTNTPEFGNASTTYNLIFGATRNPWNLERTAGGSSGGSGAAVAAGLLPLAEGSDAGGSIRNPAALNGVYGFKPSWGLVPTNVLGPFSAHSPFFAHGPLSRTVIDAAVMFQVMAGFDYSDPFTHPVEIDVLTNLDRGIRGLKVAYSPDMGGFAVDEQVQKRCDEAAKVFAELGCQVDEVSPRFEDRELLEKSLLVLWYGLLAAMFSDLPEDKFALLNPAVQAAAEEGKRISAVEFWQAQFVRETVFAEFERIFESYDLLIAPTANVAAFDVNLVGPKEINGRPVDHMVGWHQMWLFNMTGSPVASVPCGFTDENLPVGLQIIGRRLDDALVFRASRAFEQAMPWRDHRPPID